MYIKVTLPAVLTEADEKRIAAALNKDVIHQPGHAGVIRIVGGNAEDLRTLLIEGIVADNFKIQD